MDDNERIFTYEHQALKLCRNGIMLFNVNDAFVGRSLDLYGEWAQSELDIFAQVVPAGGVAIDVGANIGTHTVFLAHVVGPQGTVHAFEPQRLVFQNLCANVALHALTNVTAHPMAVGANPGSTRIPLLDPSAPQNFGCNATGSDGEAVTVATIDQLELAQCHLIKIDVEGVEANVLRGAAETIARCRPVLFVENNTEGEASREVIQTMLDLGYTGYWHLAPYFNPANHFGNAEDVFADYRPEANMLCLPEAMEIEGATPVLGPEDTWRMAHERMHGGGSSGPVVARAAAQ